MPDALLREVGTFPTAHASKYLQQLCKHFAHKIEVCYDAETGQASLPTGPASLEAGAEMLTVVISGADEEALKRARFIIDDHLKRFAFREEFTEMDWRAVN